jgi:hypothetical protein
MDSDKLFGLVAAVIALAATMGCGGASGLEPDASGGSAGDLTACAPGAALTGTSYDLAKSRFAFGSAPVQQVETTLVRWVGTDGALAIFSDGSEGASLNGGAPESSRPDWSNDPTALGEHGRAYFIAMGVAPCQAPEPQINGGSGGRTVLLARSVNGIPVAESIAWAHFDDADETTGEGFYWPTVPADVVTAARAFRDRLADPAGLAAYKAMLPAEAQGDGRVLIHHTSMASGKAFAAAASYDVFENNPDGKGSNHDFDANGNEVQAFW